MTFKEARRGPNNGFNNTGLRFGDHGTKEILLGVVELKEFDRFQTLRNNVQQGVQTDATCNTPQFKEFLAKQFPSVCREL